MTHGGYDAFDDPYCYKGTFILKNKAGLREPGAVQDFELEMSSLRADEPCPPGVLVPPITKPSITIYSRMSIDGPVTTVRFRTAKNGNVFCYPEHIALQMNLLFDRLKGRPFNGGNSFAEFVQPATHFLADLNAIHPFREGNGRSQLSFLHLIALRAGHPLELARIDPVSFLAAMIASFGGDLSRLETELAHLRR